MAKFVKLIAIAAAVIAAVAGYNHLRETRELES